MLRSTQHLQRSLLRNCQTVGIAQTQFSNSLKTLELKKKFHNNRNVPDLFKNSKTDDYVSNFFPCLNLLLLKLSLCVDQKTLGQRQE